MKTVIGRLIHVQEIHEGFQCLSGLWFQPEDGEPFEVTSARSATPRNTLLEAYFEDSNLVHFNVLVWERRETLNKNIALIWVCAPGQSATESNWKIIRDNARDMQAELRRQSKGYWEVNVTPYVLEGYTGNRDVITADWNWIKNNTSRGHTYYHCWGGFKSGILGHAIRDYWAAWTFVNGDYRTIIHEQGHNFGCGHATGGYSNQYGGSGWMASPKQFDSFNAAHQYFMGILDNETIYKLDPDASVVVHIIDPDSEPRARYPGLFCGIEIVRGYSEKWIIAPYQGKLGYFRSEGNSWSTTVEGTELPFYCELLNKSNGIYSVDVRWDERSAPPTPKAKPELPLPNPMVPITAGVYHDPAIFGQGLDVWVTGDEQVVYWYTVDRAGKPCWYLCKGSTELEILDPTQREFEKSIGKMILFTDTAGKAKAWFGFDEGACGLMDLDLLVVRDSEAGLFEFVGQEHSGLSVCNASVAYVFETRTVITSFSRHRETGWYLANEPILYDVEGVSPRVVNEGQVREAGSISWNTTQCRYMDRSYELNRIL